MGEQNYVTQEEHKEFVKRMDDENARQNHRLSILETGLAQIHEIASSVKVLAVNMENMTNEQKKLGDKLTEIESVPKKRWEAAVIGLIGAIVGALGAAIMAGIIH